MTNLTPVNPAQARMLAQLDSAKRALAEARTIDEAKDIRDKAEAIRGYYQQQRDSLEAQNYAAELKLRAERKLGEMLKETEKNDGAKGLGSNQHLVRLQPATAPPKLSDLGIEKTQSSRWQKIADLPDEVFEQEIQEAKVNAEELTTARLLRVAQERKVEQKHEEVAEQRKQAPNRAQFMCMPCTDYVQRFGARSVDLLLTDPPYSTDVDDFAAFVDSWLHPALDLVSDAGRALICTGAYPYELLVYLRRFSHYPRLTLDNPLVWTYRNTLGPAPAKTFKLNWQCIWHLYGPDAPPLNAPLLNEQFSVMDIAAPDGRQGDRYHPWQKPEALAERLVRLCSSPGDVVVDPFAGTGTFAIVAAQLGRKAFGADSDAEALTIAQQRGGEVIEK